MEISEVIRCWQRGISLRHIASGTGLSRDTVRKYVAASEEEGLANGGVQVHSQQPVVVSGTGCPGLGQQFPAHPVQPADMASAEGAQSGRRLDHADQHPPGS